MIDTIKFRIPISQKLHDIIQKKSIEISKFDHENDRSMFRFFNKKVKFGSYDRNVNIMLYDDNYCSIELSMPKLFYGHNVFMISSSQVIISAKELQKTLCKMFTTFPDIIFWEVTRLDICYAWKLPNEGVAEQIINILRGVDVPRMRKHYYDTSVMWNNKETAIKFYLKHPEYYTHDFKELKNTNNPELAYNFLMISEGVLRFEVTLRHRALASCFYGKTEDRCILLDEDIINDVVLIEKLNKYMLKVLRLKSIKATNYKEVFQNLKDFYGITQARNLFLYYKLLFTQDKNEKELLKTFSQPQKWRYTKKLQEAGIGLSTDIINESFDLQIPSEYSVNNPSARSADGS
jgi:II/X family phage/plasmid replication protein